jgi:hypothetical protein
MVASAAAGRPARAAEPGAEKPLFAGVFEQMLSVFGIGASGITSRTGSLPRPAPGPKVLPEEVPVPPVRPAEFAETSGPDFSLAPSQARFASEAGSATVPQAGSVRVEPAQENSQPPPRPAEAAAQGSKATAARTLSKPWLPAILTGAQPILSPEFRAYAELGRRGVVGIR